jgi:hypothetical protein
MKSNDWKYFLIGVLSSITAVIVWDVIKYEKKLVEFKPKDEN